MDTKGVKKREMAPNALNRLEAADFSLKLIDLQASIFCRI